MISSLNTIINTINTYYSIHDIYKSFIICDTDDEVYDLAKLMENELYTVCKITSHEMTENTVTISSLMKLWNFNTTCYRVIIISFHVWELLSNELEVHILPEQNLIILNLNKINNDIICTWVKDTLYRGFITRPSSNIMIIQNNTPEIYSLVDTQYNINTNINTNINMIN